jgi:hypothetical protein
VMEFLLFLATHILPGVIGGMIAMQLTKSWRRAHYRAGLMSAISEVIGFQVTLLEAGQTSGVAICEALQALILQEVLPLSSERDKRELLDAMPPRVRELVIGLQERQKASAA